MVPCHLYLPQLHTIGWRKQSSLCKKVIPNICCHVAPHHLRWYFIPELANCKCLQFDINLSVLCEKLTSCGPEGQFNTLNNFSKAFDLINRTIPFYKLMNSGWNGRVIDMFRSLYRKTHFRVKRNGSRVQHCWTSSVLIKGESPVGWCLENICHTYVITCDIRRHYSQYFLFILFIYLSIYLFFWGWGGGVGGWGGGWGGGVGVGWGGGGGGWGGGGGGGGGVAVRWPYLILRHCWRASETTHRPSKVLFAQ